MCMHVCAAMGTLFGLSVFFIFSIANSVSPTSQIRDYDVVSVAGTSCSPKVLLIHPAGPRAIFHIPHA